MRKYMKTVLNDFVVGTTAVYTDTSYNDALGSVDKIALHVVIDQVSGTSPTLTLALEHSCDGRNWVAKNISGADISGQALLATATNSFFASDAGTVPFMGFVRIRVALGGTSPVAHVKVHLTGRDDA
jgi:hypothetical protein